jgi:uncharacterized protein YcbK (DUF882 family)
MKLTSNFSLNEFQSKDGSPFPDTVIENLRILAGQLQALRDHLVKPIKIVSGYRSKEHNLKIGGALDSFHVRGMAADIRVEGMKPKEVAQAIELLISQGKMLEGGIGIYRTWTHYDHRNKKIRWKK